MAADEFVLSGSYATTPLSGDISLAPSFVAPIDERVTLTNKLYQEYSLDSDMPVSVAFGGLTSANVVILKAAGGKVRARITSADGSAQAVPFDSYWILMSLANPVTALDLTRTPATPITVQVFLGEI
jgi:hypothetical protein